ncbi:hypothetical protein CAPTEDRAFT_223621 [Capitella teleta]|uniref:CARD domain-containing protein n=1 Tax=Capitella teleta TaxID=283909 RepID=R7UWS2_CAPTE|nr:hypothetical protein CAPTEDRAFT_223621 [Capitella teleta]|eukprot:ELU10769.1 hypothetical protein CAPTEDRAFT_223621 [Capitella teleta]
MDDFEKRVLKQRKNTLVEHLTVNLELLNAFRGHRVLTEDMVEIIMTEKTNPSRVHKLIDFLVGCPRISAFEDMCAALMMCPGDLNWLAKELQTGVKADRGNLVIDDDVMKEAAMITHRKFGTSKRFSELDKKDMTELIAVKIQISKEEWKQELDLVKENLEAQKNAIKSRDQQSRALREELVEFIKDNEAALTSQAHGMTTTSEHLRGSVADDDLMAILVKTSRFLTKRIKTVLKEKEMFMHEREKCMDIIQAKMVDREKPLDQLLLLRLDQFPKLIEQHQKDITQKDNIMERQRTMLKELEDEMVLKEQEINELKSQIAQKTGEIGALQSRMMKSEREAEELQLERDSSNDNMKSNGKARPKRKSATKKVSTSSK